MYIGIDIGGTHIRVASGGKGKILEKLDFPTRDFHSSFQEIKNAVETLSNNERVEKIGIGISGPLESKKKKLLRPPHLPGWENIEIEEIFNQLLKAPVIVEHDASVAALGEYYYGAGIGKNPLLYYTVSTGVGIGLISNGRIFKGVYNPEAGHQILGLNGLKCLCGQDGDLETYASGEMLELETGQKPAKLEGTSQWKEDLEWLSIGIANSILHYSPEAIVIGGSMTKHKSHFFPYVTKYLRKHLNMLPQVPILPAGLGQDSGVIGALTLAEKW